MHLIAPGWACKSTLLPDSGKTVRRYIMPLHYSHPRQAALEVHVFTLRTPGLHFSLNNETVTVLRVMTNTVRQQCYLDVYLPTTISLSSLVIVNLSLGLIKHYAMKTYGGVEV
jgi:hypothetical protein